MSNGTGAAQRLQTAIELATGGLVDRQTLVELVILAAVAGEHVVIVGPPGTAKSHAVRRVAAQLGGRYFEYLLGRFTEPSELFGPVDLQRLKEGVVETRTDGMLPEAEIAFLDEVFRGSTAILNTLLGVLNERKFRRGASMMTCPLRVCIGATNELPEDETLAAFSDRFLVQLFVDPVADSLLEDLLESGWEQRDLPGPAASIADLDEVAQAMARVDMAGVRPALADAVRTLRSLGIGISDRRVVRSQRLIAAAAALAGREAATGADLWPLVYAVPGAEDQSRARDALREQLQAAENEALCRAAEDASAGPIVRATRLVSEGNQWLDALKTDPSSRSHRLRLEAVAREIDASFAPGSIPSELADVRAVIAQRLGADEPKTGA